MHMSVAQAYAILEHSSVVELPAYIRRVPGSIPGVPIFQNGGATMISEFVEYVKQVWKNKPNVSSPLNADRMNHMEAGIENNSKKIKETVTAVNELTEKSIKADVLEITTNEFSNVNLSNYGYTVENTIAVYVVGGLSGYNAHARLYTYNGLLYALITDSGSNNGFKNTKVELKMLHI